MTKSTLHCPSSVYRDLKGKTYEERVRECPSGYWCYRPTAVDDNMPDEHKTTEVWADPHGMFCPICKTACTDTGPWLSFLCTNCGLVFELELFTQEVSGRKVALIWPS